MRVVGKVIAYITQADKLLIFEHVHSPEAGIQVPAGTIEPDELPDEAVIREASEETGFNGFRIVEKLGEAHRDMSDFDKAEIHHRHFYHLICDESLPERWQHGEFDASDGTGTHIFQYYWVPLNERKLSLVADQDQLLYIIRDKMHK